MDAKGFISESILFPNKKLADARAKELNAEMDQSIKDLGKTSVHMHKEDDLEDDGE